MAKTQTMEPSAFFEEFMAGMQELRKFQEETAQQMKEIDKRVGEITNRFGDMVEYMVIAKTKLLYR